MPAIDATKTAPFREEHHELEEHLDHLRAAAREVPELSIEERALVVRRILDFVQRDLFPHAEAEELTIYREVGRVLGNPWATGPMIYDHLLIRRKVHELEQADPAEGPLLQEHLIALHTLVTSHFEKEEQLYLPLLESEDEAEVRKLYDRLIAYEHDHGRP
jgi:iron-sulfur cluster repair protein YtfE (RIC family)